MAAFIKQTDAEKAQELLQAIHPMSRLSIAVALFERIEHGDAAQRACLKDELFKFFDVKK